METSAVTPVRVNKVTKIRKEPVVYDVSVPGNNNLFVCSEISQKPVLAHNCAYVEKQYNIKIDGWILIYVSRDKSFRDYVSVGDDYTKKDRKRMEALIKDYDKKFDIAIKAKTYENIIPLIEDKPCSCRSDYLDKFHNDYDPCPLAKNGTCFKPDKLESTMKKLAKNMKSKKEKNNV